jgi:hypothetical protein
MIERRMANSRFSGEEKVLSSMEPELKKTITQRKDGGLKISDKFALYFLHLANLLI